MYVGQSFAVGGVLVKTAAWTHLLALFISNTPLVSGGLVPPTNEKMSSN